MAKNILVGSAGAFLLVCAVCLNPPFAVNGSDVGAALTDTFAGATEDSETRTSYYLYTGALKQSETGVVAVPSRFKWSIETSWRGLDAQGKDLPDRRVMLRLYDPDPNWKIQRRR